MRIVLFLLGLLVDRFTERSKKADDAEATWKHRMDEFEATLPEPGERTIEQWEELVNLTGERYYSMAASSHAGGAMRSVVEMRDAVKEVAG